MLERTTRLSRPLSLRLTLGPVRRGRKDPCNRFDAGGFWRATRTPFGPATTYVEAFRDEVRARAWGDGAEWALDHIPELIGEHQEDEVRFPCGHPLIDDLHHRLPGLRIPRTNAVFEALIPTVLEQRVTGMEAKDSYARIVRWLGEPAPGPRGTVQLMVPPDPKRVADTPAWAFHRFGVEAKRANALRAMAARANRMEEALTMNHEDARRRLMAVPGIGPWTAAVVANTAIGDPDAVIVGDYHIHDWVTWALAKEPRGDDRRMLELLEPFRGQRGRVVRLIGAGHPLPPKFGPKYSPLPIAHM